MSRNGIVSDCFFLTLIAKASMPWDAPSISLSLLAAYDTVLNLPIWMILGNGRVYKYYSSSIHSFSYVCSRRNKTGPTQQSASRTFVHSCNPWGHFGLANMQSLWSTASMTHQTRIHVLFSLHHTVVQLGFRHNWLSVMFKLAQNTPPEMAWFGGRGVNLQSAEVPAKASKCLPRT